MWDQPSCFFIRPLALKGGVSRSAGGHAVCVYDFCACCSPGESVHEKDVCAVFYVRRRILRINESITRCGKVLSEGQLLLYT